MAPEKIEEVKGLLADPDDYVRAGEALAAQRRFAKAIGMYRKAIKLKPDHVAAFCRWAEALFEQEKYEGAIEKWRRVTELRPTFAPAHFEWGRCLAKLRRHAEAAEQYRQAAELDPADADAFNNWGVALLNGGDFAAAIEKYRHATELKPDFALAYHNWGIALADGGEQAGAIEKYGRAAALGAEGVHYDWGLALERLGKYSEAIEHYRIAAQEKPNDARIANACGAALANLGRPDEAIEFYRKATDIDPNLAFAFRNWGLALAEQAKYPEAIEKYRRADEIKPNDAAVYNAWGAALGNQRQVTEAIAYYRRATELDPKFALAYFNLGSALSDQRKYAEAIEQYKNAIAADPHNASAFLAWGIALAEQGRYREAIDVTRRIIEFDRDYAYAYHNVAHFYWRKGDYKPSRTAWNEAVEAYEKTKEAKRKERNADFFSYYGGVLHEHMGDLKRAEEVLLEGLAIDPDHPDILMRLGSLYTERYRDPVREADDNWAATFWDARDCLARAEQELRRRLEPAPDATALQRLGELFLLTEDFEEARKHLAKAYELDPKNAALSSSLGVAFSRTEDYHRAAGYYSAGLKQSPGDLSIWSNLAETYLKLDKRDRAEKEYRKILAIAADHIDSQVGLGEVYTAMADAGDSELYEVALRYYDRAIQLAEARNGSKRVTRKELASMYYARGYAAVQAYEAQGRLGEEAYLNKALKDFTNCVQLDPEHYKGDRAKRKIVERRKVFSADWFTRKVAPWFIVVPAVAIFLEAQMAHYHLGRLAEIKVGEYSALTFGALMFIVVGLFLPQIQKLKGAGIELEKSPVNQITTSAALGIKK
jgi:tetratricopeptide (TPR) repeat protein